jgi:hypothetical protein
MILRVNAAPGRRSGISAIKPARQCRVDRSQQWRWSTGLQLRRRFARWDLRHTEQLTSGRKRRQYRTIGGTIDQTDLKALTRLGGQYGDRIELAILGQLHRRRSDLRRQGIRREGIRRQWD